VQYFLSRGFPASTQIVSVSLQHLLATNCFFSLRLCSVRKFNFNNQDNALYGKITKACTYVADAKDEGNHNQQPQMHLELCPQAVANIFNIKRTRDPIFE
jgi:hypothetical protein